MHFRPAHPELRHLADVCSPSSARSPPSEALIADLRGRVARKLGLSAADAEAHHPASPWRFHLVRQVMGLASDSDLEVAGWLEEGTPVGIKCPIRPSGLLPLVSEQASTTTEKLQDRAQWSMNHPSFDACDGGEQPAHALLSDLIDQGFALVFADAAAAESWLGTPPVPSPLGDVTRIKADGPIKHRLIMDLKASAVNNASTVGERQVLPWYTDHACDLALSTSGGLDVGV